VHMNMQNPATKTQCLCDHRPKRRQLPLGALQTRAMNLGFFKVTVTDCFHPIHERDDNENFRSIPVTRRSCKGAGDGTEASTFSRWGSISLPASDAFGGCVGGGGFSSGFDPFDVSAANWANLY
jgi:hypothetical protein